MFIICGLGNPGKKYENTRHNMGFMALDKISEKTGIVCDKLKFKALVGEGNIAGQKAILVKPQTFMNLSGESVREIMNFYKAPTENLIVIYDDIDLETGSFRIRAKGSAGTHNGMRNIVSQLGSENFPRIRVGMGSKLKGDLVDFVIGGVTKDEWTVLNDVLDKVSDAAVDICTEGVDKAMNKYNIKPKRQQKEKEQKSGGEKVNED